MINNVRFSPVANNYSANIQKPLQNNTQQDCISLRQTFRGNNIASEPNNVQYENPISRKMEKFLASMSSLGGSLLTGGVASAIVMGLKGSKPVAAVVGLIAAGVTAALTLPGTLYNASVNSFVKEKETDVFSRVKSLETNLSQQIDQNTRNPEVSLDKNIQDYFKFNAGRQGNVNAFIATA